jgi:flagellum-specific ATP synthase
VKQHTAPGNPWNRLLERQMNFVASATPVARQGRLQHLNGLRLELSGVTAPLGALVEVENTECEVVGFSNNTLYVMPCDALAAIGPGAKAVVKQPRTEVPTLFNESHPWRRATDLMRHAPIGLGLLGRVIDARGQPLDDLGELKLVQPQPIHGRSINAMQREPVRQPLDTGVRVINALLSMGLGQRLGLFAGAGLGKSMLMGMMARYTSADVTVVGLVGERGREVKEFVQDILGVQGLKRSVVVAAPADSSPVLRMQGAHYATAIAEFYRDQGLNVLLLMDSLTRYAMAAREVALSVGEAPVTKGYPASVFAKLPQLVERTGNGINGNGSITAIYTVLAEGDDMSDPIADSAKSFLDGHIVLSRSLADAGHYPAVDIEQSISRVMFNVTNGRHQQLARKFRELWAKYQTSRDLILVGAYVPGSDASTDLAISLFPALQAFAQQQANESRSWQESFTQLEQILGGVVDGGDRS